MYDFKKGNNNEELINKGNRTKEKIDINTIIGVISIFINFLGLLLEIFINKKYMKIAYQVPRCSSTGDFLYSSHISSQ